VADLVGSEDVLRRLSLLSVQSVMSPLTDDTALDPNAPVLSIDATLRDALGILLSADTNILKIAGVEGQPVGTLDLGAIRRATHRG
jgi:CBS domain-containing protein